MDLIPWTDRRGRFDALRAAAFALLLAPALWIAWRAITDDLGPEPRNQASMRAGAGRCASWRWRWR